MEECHTLPAGRYQFLSLFFIGAYLKDAVAHVVHILGRKIHGRIAAHFGDACRRRGYDGGARRHGQQRRIAEAFVERRIDETECTGIQTGQAVGVDVGQHAEAVFVFDFSAERQVFRSRDNDFESGQPSVGKQFVESFHGAVCVFFEAVAAYEQEVFTGLFSCIGAARQGFERRIEHLYPFRVDGGEEIEQCVFGVVRHGDECTPGYAQQF